jgi:uncharacterized membrane protein YfcA
VPGVVVGTWLVGSLSDEALYMLLVVAVGVAAARELGGAWVRRIDGRPLLIPGGFTLGFASAASGAGGLIAGPLVLAAGLRGEALVAAAATIGVVVNAARVAAYGAAGMLDLALLPAGVVLTVGLILGNAAGQRLRPHLGPRALHASTWFVIATASALALAGI